MGTVAHLSPSFPYLFSIKMATPTDPIPSSSGTVPLTNLPQFQLGATLMELPLVCDTVSSLSPYMHTPITALTSILSSVKVLTEDQLLPRLPQPIKHQICRAIEKSVTGINQGDKLACTHLHQLTNKVPVLRMSPTDMYRSGRERVVRIPGAVVGMPRTVVGILRRVWTRDTTRDNGSSGHGEEIGRRVKVKIELEWKEGNNKVFVLEEVEGETELSASEMRSLVQMDLESLLIKQEKVCKEEGGLNGGKSMARLSGQMDMKSCKDMDMWWDDMGGLESEDGSNGTGSWPDMSDELESLWEKAEDDSVRRHGVEADLGFHVFAGDDNNARKNGSGRARWSL